MTEMKKMTTIFGLTSDMQVNVFNKAKEEQEDMSILDLLLNHMSGHVDYQVLGWNEGDRKYEYYDVDTVYLDNFDIPTFEYYQTQTEQKIYAGKNNQTKVLCSNHSMKKLNKIKPTDVLHVRTGDEKEPTLMLGNWVQSDGPNKNVYEINILGGRSIVVNGLVFSSI